MLIDFANDLTCILQNEVSDYQDILNILNQKDNTVLFMPAITRTDGIFNLFDKNIGINEKNMIWLIPAGQHDYFWLNILKRTISDFYMTDEAETNSNVLFPKVEPEEFEECILLHSSCLQNNPENTILDANVILVRLSLTSDREALIFILLDHQDQCWEKIIENYHIKLNWLVDSHRGMGDYYLRTQLYQLMKKTAYPEVLPDFYFKGLYNKGDIPENFQFSYAMLSQPDSNGYDKWKTFSAVFTTHWND